MKEKGTESSFKETMVENFSNLKIGINILICEAQKFPNKKNKGVYTKTHYNSIFKMQRQRDNFESSKRKATCNIQESPYKIQRISQQKPCRTGKSRMIYIQSTKRKKLPTMNILSRKTVL